MRTLHISVLDKKATYLSRDGDIVCGNSDYVIEFAFDAEWDGYTEKVARFIWNGQYKEVAFNGSTCAVPMITNATEVQVGVYAGDLSTTTPAVIGCQKSILCGGLVQNNAPVVASNIFIRYSEYADGTDFTETWSNDQRYIGVAIGRSAPTDKSGYTWSLFTAGSVVHAAHIRYSAFPDGTDFTDRWSAGLVYMGIAVAALPPTDKSEYEWMRIASNIHQTETVTLSAESWVDNKQTIEIAYIGEETSGFANPTPEYTSVYIEAGIKLDLLASRSLTFSCVNVPTEDIVVVVDITEPLVKSTIADGEQLINSKFVLRDIEGNLSAVNPKHTEYPNLIYRYEHTTNKEVYVSSVDLASGVFTAEAHGLTNGTTVIAVVNEPYHVGYPYRYLPGGLLLGQTNGSGRNAQYYYVNAVDENTFTLSTTNGGATVTFTEVSTMDLSKFHFEVHKKTDLVIKDLPNLKELLVVIKGRMSMGYRYCMPYDERASESGKFGIVGFDSNTLTDQWGSLWLGNTGGWNSAYIEVEMKFIEERHVLVIADQDYLSFKSNSEIPVAFHVRGYLHVYMNRDDMISIGINDGAFINGTTVEVYSK